MYWNGNEYVNNNNNNVLMYVIYNLTHTYIHIAQSDDNTISKLSWNLNDLFMFKNSLFCERVRDFWKLYTMLKSHENNSKSDDLRVLTNSVFQMMLETCGGQG